MELDDAGGAGVTGLTVFARAELLRPRVRSAYLTNAPVRLLMDATALATVFVIAEVASGSPVTDGFAAFMALCAVTSSAVLVSMYVHNARTTVTLRAEEATRATRHGDIADLKEAAAEIIPAEMEKAIPPVIRDLAKQPDPWEPKG